MKRFIKAFKVWLEFLNVSFMISLLFGGALMIGVIITIILYFLCLGTEAILP